MPVYSFSQATENGTTYYVTTIAPIITDNGEVEAYYQAVVDGKPHYTYGLQTQHRGENRHRREDNAVMFI